MPNYRIFLTAIFINFITLTIIKPSNFSVSDRNTKKKYHDEIHKEANQEAKDCLCFGAVCILASLATEKAADDSRLLLFVPVGAIITRVLYSIYKTENIYKKI